MRFADRYRLGALVGEGSFGEVYRATDDGRGEEIALKLLKRARPEAIARFKREFRALRDLVHPNLIALHELGADGAAWFYTMELIDGVDLTTWLGGGARQVPTVASGDDDAPAARIAPTLDGARVAAALHQLADGLDAVHGAGRLHCDLKPGNVLVDRGGRLRLLDFGQVADVGQRAERPGTAWFEAPEQAAGDVLGPAADWYAVGVLLHEAATGRLPFPGAAAAVRAAKQAGAAPPVAALAPALAPALAALIDRLLARVPEARAGAAEVRAAADALDGGAPARAATDEADAAPSVRAPEPALVGRDDELAILAAAHARAAAAPTVVRVRGPSGIGKTALCRHFVATLPDATWVLRGSCYQREQMPYRALDPLIDELAARLAALDDATRAALLPPDAGFVGRLFPVLRAITGGAAEAAPGEARARGVAAVRALFARLAAHAPLVLWLDDLQWSDADSGELLAAIVRDGPPLLCLASCRSEDAAASPVLLALAAAGVAAIDLEVPALAPAAGAALARALGGDDAGAIADEAGGSPFLVRELALAGAARRRRRLTVDDVVRDRAAALDPASRALLAAVALAGRPIAEPAAIAAAGATPLGRVEVDRLRAAGLLRATARSRAVADELDTYHDRVRQAVIGGLDDAARVALHRRLAAALTAAGGDGEAIALHHRGAGDRTAARAAAIEAARAALAAGTAERAAALYALAAEDAGDERERRALVSARGDALALAGQGGAAAAAFSAAAAGAAPDEARRLRRRAADLLLRAGHLDDGQAALAAVLHEHGLHTPRTRRGAIASLVWQRVRLALRGTRHRERAEAALAPREVERIDALWTAATCLSLIDILRGADFQTRHLRAALDAGEPTRLSRALALAAIYEGAGGSRGRARGRRLIERAAAIAERTGDPLARAMLLFAEGVAVQQAGDWPAARTRCADAMAALGAFPGAFYELATARRFWVETLVYLGDLDALIAAVPGFLDDAARRGDAYTLDFLRGGPASFRWIWQGQPARALAEIRAVDATLPRADFHVAHAMTMHAETQALLAAGDARAARDRVERAWPGAERSLVVRSPTVLVKVLSARGRAALATGDRARARACAARIRRVREPWADVLAALLEAGTGAGTWRTAAALADAGTMPLHAAAARARAGDPLTIPPAVVAALAPVAP